MIDEFDNESLNDPKSLRLLFKDLSKRIKGLKVELDDVDGNINNPDNGLKVKIKAINDDLDELDSKLNRILESQAETRKTVKNVSLTTVLTGVIGAITAFVMKQLGFL